MKQELLIGAAIVSVSLALLGVFTLASPPPPAAPAEQTPYPHPDADADSPAARTFTKTEFDDYVYSRTKTQIRDEFGSPDTVDDDSDSWYYWHLPVYDRDAGIQVHTVVIRFSGIDGPTDFVASVRYP